MRCGGSASACACVVAAGTGVSVAGDGTVDNPYVVTLASTSAGLSVADTPTVDLGLTGAGTGADPFVVTGAARTDGIMDLVGSRVADPLEYDAVTRTLGVDLTGAGAGTVDPANLISADTVNVLRQGSDGRLIVNAPAWPTNPGYGLATVSADNGGGVWQVQMGGSTYTAMAALGYAPAIGHTNVITLHQAAGMFGPGSTDPGYALMIGRLT